MIKQTKQKRPPCLRRPLLQVRAKGLEPPRLAALDPKSSASTNFATPACYFDGANILLFREKQNDLHVFLFLSSQLEIFPEVNSSNFRIISQILRRTRLQNTTIIQQISPVGNTQGLLHVMVGNQNPDIFFL